MSEEKEKVRWEKKGAKTVRLVDEINGITTAWKQGSYIEVLKEWKKEKKKLDKGDKK